MKLFNCRPQIAIITLLLLSVVAAASPALARGSVSYKPGISIVPEVFRPDGVTDETYATAQGPSLWTPDRAVPLGDKLKLSIFAATGGAELREIKVRLDNTLIADLTKAPWHTTVDTTKLGAGPHMVEVWAVATGDNPQSTTQTLSFQVASVVASTGAPTVQVGGMQIAQGPNGQPVEIPLPGSGVGADMFSDAQPQLPDALKAQTLDPNAIVTVSARSAASSEQAGGAPITDTPVTVNEPTLFIVQPAPGSTATRFAYALVRGTDTISMSPQVLRTSYDRVRIERRTDTQAGLRPGKVTMWIWGIDAQGNFASPVKTYLDIPADH